MVGALGIIYQTKHVGLHRKNFAPEDHTFVGRDWLFAVFLFLKTDEQSLFTSYSFLWIIFLIYNSEFIYTAKN